jgi:Tfp pilus assembly protein PilP
MRGVNLPVSVQEKKVQKKDQGEVMNLRGRTYPILNALLTAALAIALTLSLGCGQTTQSTGRSKGKKGTGKSPIRPSGDMLKKPAKRKKARRTRRFRSVVRPGERAPELTEQDFTENTESSRDPFRNYLKPVTVETPEKSFEDTRLVLLEQYDLAELKLSGIAGRRPRVAMFRTPNKRTTNIRKGIRISKSKALVVEIAEDHVILQIPQLTAAKRASFVERIMWVDPNRKVIEIGSKPLQPDEQGIRYSGWRRRRDAIRRRRQKGAAP